MNLARTFRAGGSIEDYCRACRTDRMHTIIVVDGDGQPLRVACGYCDSEHNYRGGPRIETSGTLGQSGREAASAATPRRDHKPPSDARRSSSDPMPIVTDRERTGAPIMLSDSTTDLELLLRRIIREEAGVSTVTPADKWRGGSLALKPGNPALQEKSWPIETFFHKVVMIRNRLRTLEQQVNASDLPDDAKVKLQGYISGCYGSLTSFNVLFADEEDGFKGTAPGS
jgi:hypothetical protein